MVYVFASLDEAFPDPFQHLVATQVPTLTPIPKPQEPSAYNETYGAPYTPPPRAFPDTQHSVEYDAVMAQPTKTIHVPGISATQSTQMTGAPIHQKDFRPELNSLVGSSLPPVPLERDGSKISLGPIETLQLPKQMFSPCGKPLNVGGSTLISKLPKTTVENFTEQTLNIPMPQSKGEWETMIQQLENYGKARGWNRNNFEWQIWLQDMIPYILFGVFVLFVLEGTIRLGKSKK